MNKYVWSRVLCLALLCSHNPDKLTAGNLQPNHELEQSSTDTAFINDLATASPQQQTQTANLLISLLSTEQLALISAKNEYGFPLGDSFVQVKFFDSGETAHPIHNVFAFDAQLPAENHPEKFVHQLGDDSLSSTLNELQNGLLQNVKFIPEFDTHKVTGLSFDPSTGDLWVTTKKGLFVARATENHQNFSQIDVEEEFDFQQEPLWGIHNERFAFAVGDRVNIGGVGFLRLPADESLSISGLDYDHKTGDLWVTTKRGLYVARAGEGYPEFTSSHSLHLPPGTGPHFWDVNNHHLAYIEGDRVTVDDAAQLKIPLEQPFQITGLDFNSSSEDLWVMTDKGLFLASAKDGYRELTRSHSLKEFTGSSDPDWDIEGDDRVGPDAFEQVVSFESHILPEIPFPQMRLSNSITPLGGSLSDQGLLLGGGSFGGGGGSFGGGGGSFGGGGGSFGGGGGSFGGGGGSFGGGGGSSSGGGASGGGPTGGGETNISELTIVPEPASILLWLLGAVGSWSLLLRRKLPAKA